MVNRANSYEEIRPLVEFCKTGKLFEAQEWIKGGRPVNPPLPEPKTRQYRTPLYYAIERGFHSLVGVLLDGGAEIEYIDRYNALRHALQAKRLDLVEVLLTRGANVRSISMEEIFETYDPEIMEYFIERGADVETGNPLATAFCERIQPALRIFKKYRDRFPSFQEQVNIALRYHCGEGNTKWIALMLWAGADPWAKGPADPDADPDPEMDDNALELAARRGHLEIFKMRGVRLDPSHKHAFDLVQQACYAKTADLLTELLRLNFPVNNQVNGGSSLIHQLASWMSCSRLFEIPARNRNIDDDSARERLKMLHLIVKNGARWIPEDLDEVSTVRKEMLRLTSDYTAEFVWIMTTYGGCSRSVLETLLKTPSIRSHARGHLLRMEELIAKLPQV